MRDNEPHAIPCRIAIGFAIAPENQVNEGRRRFFQARLPRVDEALRLDPLLIETALYILAVRDELGRASDLANLAQQQRLCRRVELCVTLFVQF